MWKLTLGTILGFILLAVGLGAMHLESTLMVVVGWVGTLGACVAWIGVIWWAAVGHVKSPL